MHEMTDSNSLKLRSITYSLKTQLGWKQRNYEFSQVSVVAENNRKKEINCLLK